MRPAKAMELRASSEICSASCSEVRTNALSLLLIDLLVHNMPYELVLFLEFIKLLL